MVWTYFKQDSVILIRFSKLVELRNLLIFYSIVKEQFLVFGWIDAKLDKNFSIMPKLHELFHKLLVAMTLFTKSSAISEYQNKNYSQIFLENFVRISECSSKWILISGILSEYTKVNYKKRYGSLLKMKNHVIEKYILL